MNARENPSSLIKIVLFSGRSLSQSISQIYTPRKCVFRTDAVTSKILNQLLWNVYCFEESRLAFIIVLAHSIHHNPIEQKQIFKHISIELILLLIPNKKHIVFVNKMLRLTAEPESKAVVVKLFQSNLPKPVGNA